MKGFLSKSNKDDSKNPKDKYSIQAVENALDVLEQFLGNKTELGVSELSRNLDLKKNNIFRILATLEKRGYIEQNKNNDHYKIGIKVLELGRAYLSQTGLIKVAVNQMEELVSHLNETVYLGIMRNFNVFVIEGTRSTHALRVASQIGYQLSPFYTAIGKVLLAYYDEDERDRVIQNNPFEALTENSITDKDTFLTELRSVKEKGYAIDNEEMDVGVTGVAAPIFNYENQIVAALSVSGPTTRFTKKALQDQFIPNIIEYSKKISIAIGYTGKP